MSCTSSPNVVGSSSNLSNQPYLTLNSNYKIPQYGLGVYQIEEMKPQKKHAWKLSK